MVSIFIVTHGNLSKAFLETAELLAGSISDVYTLGLYHEDSIDEFAEKADEIINNTEHLLIFTDILGGSPCMSIAKRIMHANDAECIVGVNLPLLLEAIMRRETVQTAKDLKGQLLDLASKSIVDLKNL